MGRETVTAPSVRSASAGMSLTVMHPFNWEILTDLTPEVYEGAYPAHNRESDAHERKQDLDRHEQYYLALFGLELIRGRKPCRVRCYKDLEVKCAFFDDPRSFFEDGGLGDANWIDAHPEFAFVLNKMLSKDPQVRYESADIVCKELQAIADGAIPDSVRQAIGETLDLLSKSDFAADFYQRLIAIRPSLKGKFRDLDHQSTVLTNTLIDLIAVDPKLPRSRFGEIAKSHSRFDITAEDVAAFRRAFLETIAQNFPGDHQLHDAWNSLLKHALGMMEAHLSDKNRRAAAYRFRNRLSDGQCPASLLR